MIMKRLLATTLLLPLLAVPGIANAAATSNKHSSSTEVRTIEETTPFAQAAPCGSGEQSAAWTYQGGPKMPGGLAPVRRNDSAWGNCTYQGGPKSQPWTCKSHVCK
jgi:hypothetical protein